jgi:hypothetical protein
MAMGIKVRKHKGEKKFIGDSKKSQLLLIPIWHFTKAEDNHLELNKINKNSM